MQVFKVCFILNVVSIISLARRLVSYWMSMNLKYGDCFGWDGVHSKFMNVHSKFMNVEELN